MTFDRSIRALAPRASGIRLSIYGQDIEGALLMDEAGAG